MNEQNSEPTSGKTTRVSGMDFLHSLDPDAHAAALELEFICPDLAHHMVDLLYGRLYQREKLSLRERILVTVTGLIASGSAPQQLRNQVLISLKNGFSREELFEVALQSSVFCGFAKAINAMLLIDAASIDNSAAI